MHSTGRRMTRRRFLHTAGAAALAVGVGASIIIPGRASALSSNANAPSRQYNGQSRLNNCLTRIGVALAIWKNPYEPCASSSVVTGMSVCLHGTHPGRTRTYAFRHMLTFGRWVTV